MANLVFLATVVVTSLLILLGFALLVARFYRRVPPGRALVIATPANAVRVTFGGTMVLPVVHEATEVDLAERAVTWTGPLATEDGAARITAKLRAHLPPNAAAVRAALAAFGPTALDDHETMQSRLTDHLVETLRAAAAATPSDPRTLEQAWSERLRAGLHGLELRGVVDELEPEEAASTTAPATQKH